MATTINMTGIIAEAYIIFKFKMSILKLGYRNILLYEMTVYFDPGRGIKILSKVKGFLTFCGRILTLFLTNTISQ